MVTLHTSHQGVYEDSIQLAYTAQPVSTPLLQFYGIPSVSEQNLILIYSFSYGRSSSLQCHCLRSTYDGGS